MSSSPDLTLPFQSPTEAYQPEFADYNAFALYTLANLSKEEIKTIRHANDPLELVLELPETYDFTGGSLLDVYDHHLRYFDRSKRFHPTILLVAHHQDYKKQGILLLNLDSDMNCTVDFCRVRFSSGLGLALSIRLKNMKWKEVKHDYELPSPTGQYLGPRGWFRKPENEDPSQPDPSQAWASWLTINHPWNGIADEAPRWHRQWFFFSGAERKDLKENGGFLGAHGFGMGI